MLTATEALKHYSPSMTALLSDIENKILEMRSQDEYAMEYALPPHTEVNKIDHIIQIFRDAGYLTFYDNHTNNLLINIPIKAERQAISSNQDD
jgi:hypothetical protein